MSPRHCSQCGTRMVTADIGGRQREQCPACGFVAWRNPAPVGMAVIEHEGQLVLIRRRDAPLADYWAPPAGYVEIGESVPEAVIREAGEECGLEIALDGLAGVYSQADVDVLIVAYRAHSTGGRLRAGDDAADVALFARGDAPLQPPPAAGSTIDRWLHRVVVDVTAPWRTAPGGTMESHNPAGGSPLLAQRLLDYLRPGAPALMLTVGADGHAASAYTWVVAMDAAHLRFGVDFGSSSMENLQRSGQVALQIIGPGDISFLVKGTARCIKHCIEVAAPAQVMLWELDVTTSRDQSWPGVSTTALGYAWPDSQREAMLAMEQAVYAEMRNFA